MKTFIRSLLLFFLFSQTLSAAENKDIQVVGVVGKAKVGGRALRAGDYIKVNEVIETGENSGVKIRLGDRTVIDIAATSTFRVEAVRGSTKDETVTVLEEGGAKASIPSNSAVKASVIKSLSQKPKFYMKTKWSVIAVRGTSFFAVSNKETGSGAVGCFQGEVILLSPNGKDTVRQLSGGLMVSGNNSRNGIGGWTEGKVVAPSSLDLSAELNIDSNPTEAALVSEKRSIASSSGSTGGYAASVGSGAGASTAISISSVGSSGLAGLVLVKMKVARDK